MLIQTFFIHYVRFKYLLKDSMVYIQLPVRHQVPEDGKG